MDAVIPKRPLDTADRPLATGPAATREPSALEIPAPKVAESDVALPSVSTKSRPNRLRPATVLPDSSMSFCCWAALSRMSNACLPSIRFLRAVSRSDLELSMNLLKSPINEAIPVPASSEIGAAARPATPPSALPRPWPNSTLKSSHISVAVRVPRV